MMTNSGRWSKMLDPTTLDGSISRRRLESSEIRKRSVIGEEQKVGEEKLVDERDIGFAQRVHRLQ